MDVGCLGAGLSLRFYSGEMCRGVVSQLYTPAVREPLLPCLALCVELPPLTGTDESLLHFAGYLVTKQAYTGSRLFRVWLGHLCESGIKLKILQNRGHQLTENTIASGLLAFPHATVPSSMTNAGWLPSPELNAGRCGRHTSLQCWDLCRLCTLAKLPSWACWHHLS